MPSNADIGAVEVEDEYDSDSDSEESVAEEVEEAPAPRKTSAAERRGSTGQKVDPMSCYMVAYKKEGVGKLMKKSKVLVTFVVCIEG